MKLLPLRSTTTIEPRARLICLPYAGGGAHIYRTWPRALPPWLDVLSVELPGRGRLFKEPALTSIAEIVDRLEPLLAPLSAIPYVLFGHSMGALIAFEVVRRLKRNGHRQPRTLFVSGRNAPQSPPAPPIHQLNDADLVAEIIAYDGSPKEVFEDTELRALFLTLLRADFAVVGTYRFEDLGPLDCDIDVFLGDADPKTSPTYAEPWRQTTRGRTTFSTFAGGHFFIRSAEAEVVARVTKSVAAALALD